MIKLTWVLRNKVEKFKRINLEHIYFINLMSKVLLIDVGYSNFLNLI